MIKFIKNTARLAFLLARVEAAKLEIAFLRWQIRNEHRRLGID